MKKHFRAPWWAIALLLILAVLVAFAACTRENDTEDPASDDFGGDGDISGVGDDDDDDNSGDDDDDDDDTGSNLRIAVVQGNTNQTSAYKAFFTAYGFDGTFVNEADLPTFNFNPYDLILVTQTCTFYQFEQVDAVEKADKKILAVNQGGAILAGKMDKYANLGAGYDYTFKKIQNTSPESLIWENPFDVDMTPEGVVTISSITLEGIAHSTIGAPYEFTTFAEPFGQADRAVLSMQGKFFYWGIEFDPDEYTVDLLKLMANVIEFLG